MNGVFVHGVGLSAPGLDGFEGSRAVLRGEVPWGPTPRVVRVPDLLLPSERRRVTRTIGLALQVAEDAAKQAGFGRETLAPVFACSGGDFDIVDAVCRALTLPERPVSPTKFHNSVHNAPVGYWTIAAASRGPSTALAAHDATFGAALLEAWTLCAHDGLDALLVAYDEPPPAPLAGAVAITAPFGVAFVLSRQAGPGAIAQLSVHSAGEAASHPRGRAGDDPHGADGSLESLRRAVPAARALPLLQAIAREHIARVVLQAGPEYPVTWEVVPCAQTSLP